MKRRELIRSLATALAGAVVVSLAGPALARVGRRASPNSVGGVRRRRRRRRRRRVHRNQRLYSLPSGCGTQRVRAGVTYYYCNGIWYRPSYEGTTVIYVVEDIDAGADGYAEFEE